MSTSTPPMDHGSPPASPLKDERELERLFRAHYSAFIEEAQGRLADAPGSAPRVVEIAFRHAWEQRERFHSEAELDAFLHEEVQHGAARELSRRVSAHRLGTLEHAAQKQRTSGSLPNVDESWKHLSEAIHHTTTGVDAHVQSKQALRHDAAVHVAELAKKRSLKAPIALGVAGLAIVAAGFWYLNRAGEERSVLSALAANDARPSMSPTGSMAIVNLDDGGKVTLVPESKLIVPKAYGPNLRAVRIEGAARFVVTASAESPFQVRARDVAVNATGTDFVVRLYPGDSTVYAAVLEGTVQVKVGDSTRSVGRGAAIAVPKGGTIRDATADETAELTTWTEGKLTIANRKVRDVLPELKRWYGLDLKVPDVPLLDRPVTMTASLDSPMEAIKGVEQSAQLKFGYEGETMVFRDAAPKPK